MARASASSTVTVGSGATLTTGSNTLNIVTNGAAVVNGTLTLGSACTLPSGATMTVGSTGKLTTTQTYTSTGTTTVNGTFELGEGGWATGSNFTYGSSGTLQFANTTGSYGVNGTDVFWPTTNGPVNVTVSGNGMTLNAARTVTGTFQTSSGITNSNNLTFNGTAQINAGGYFVSAPTYGSGSTLKYNTGGSYGRSAEWSATSGAGYPYHVQLSNNTTLDLGANSGAGTARQCAGNLTIDAGSTMSLSASAMTQVLNVRGNLSLAGTLALSGSGGGDLRLGGNWTRTGTFTPNNRAVFFDGSAAQTVTGATTFDYLILDNTAGLSLANDATVNKTLTFTNGKITTGANTLTLGSAGSISGAGAGKYVYGTLAQSVATGASAPAFAIGDASTYAPVELTFPNVTSAGTLSASTTAAAQPNLGTSSLSNTKYVNRYWTITNSGLAFTTYDAVFHYVAGDVAGGASTSALQVGKYSGGSWSYPTVGTRTATTTQATGLTSFSDFALAESGNWTITASAGSNGRISPSGAVSVANAGSQSFTITPDAHYHVADVLVDGASVGAVTSYSFTNVTADHTIAASFALDTYTITASAGANGSISPNGATTVSYGGSQSYTISANSGYHVADVLVDGVSAGAVTSYSFTSVAANHTIAASFAADPATISAVSPSGTISSSTTSLNVPVTVSRVDNTANRLFHVTFQLAGGLTLTGGTSGIVEGDYLNSSGATTNLQVTDNGGGSYTVDGTILGLPCNNVATSGTLFTIPVSSSSASGTGTVTLTETTLRDCDNATLASSIGTAASVDIDNRADRLRDLARRW
ncbi:MAG: hypothetical protein U0704_01155 [Candidatus Eisenbacteria bacterium]